MFSSKDNLLRIDETFPNENHVGVRKVFKSGNSFSKEDISIHNIFILVVVVICS